MMPSDISVVVPVHENRGYLEATMRSILDQTLPPAEIVIVDDGSSDGSGDFAAGLSPLVRVVRTPGLGCEPARDLGVQTARFPVIAFCDSDDLWAPTKLERQRAVVSDVASPILVWTGLTEFISPEIDPATFESRVLRTDELGLRLVSALLTTKATFDVQSASMAEAGSWIAWVAGLPDGIEVVHIPEVLMSRRMHATNASRSDNTLSSNLLRAVRERARRRQDGAS